MKFVLRTEEGLVAAEVELAPGQNLFIEAGEAGDRLPPGLSLYHTPDGESLTLGAVDEDWWDSIATVPIR